MRITAPDLAGEFLTRAEQGQLGMLTLEILEAPGQVPIRTGGVSHRREGRVCTQRHAYIWKGQKEVSCQLALKNSDSTSQHICQEISGVFRGPRL